MLRYVSVSVKGFVCLLIAGREVVSFGDRLAYHGPAVPDRADDILLLVRDIRGPLQCLPQETAAVSVALAAHVLLGHHDGTSRELCPPAPRAPTSFVSRPCRDWYTIMADCLVSYSVRTFG